jgi:prepilin-type processing-associated H-X9-DG protein
VCLSNVKNIALAIQMYLADNNDTLPPKESRPEVQEVFDLRAYTIWGEDWACLEMPSVANPYLNWVVTFDEYIKNRDVWRCPSAKVEAVPGLIWGDTDWFSQFKANEELFGGESGTLCLYNSFPSGWGGPITDTFAQLGSFDGGYGASAPAKAFVQSITTNQANNRGLKLVSVDDPVRFVIVGESSAESSTMSASNVAYPDICWLMCSSEICHSSEGGDWELMATEDCCGEAYSLYAPGNGAFLRNPDLRKPYARHLGGVNLGFLDGHASWTNSEALITGMRDGDIDGIPEAWPNSTCDGGFFPATYPGVPTLY